MSLMQPKKTKYAKMHKGRIRGFATRGDKVSFGSCGIKSTEIGLITARQIESARRAIVRAIKRGGQVWIRIFPDKPITKKPLEVRQGKGKGSVDHWAAVVKPGTVLFELEGIDLELARHALRLAGYKLPVRTRFVEREVI